MDEELTIKEEADTSDIEINADNIKQEVPVPFAFVAVKTEVQVIF
jgi:hypothetical protein